MKLASALAALDALRDGDARLVEAILLDVVGGEGTAAPELACPVCGIDCRYPGQLDNHLRVVHWVPDTT